MLHGGQAVPPLYPAETWTWDGTTWERQVASGAGPGGRIHYGMTYDATAQRVLLFGGVLPGSGTLGDTWAWTGSWSSAANAASPRSHAELGMSASGAIVVGGFDQGAVVMQLNGQTCVDADLNQIVRNGQQNCPRRIFTASAIRYIEIERRTKFEFTHNVSENPSTVTLRFL